MTNQPNIFGYCESFLMRGLIKDMGANGLEPEDEIITDNHWHKSNSYKDRKHIEVAYRANFTYQKQELMLTAEYYLVAAEYPEEGPAKFTYSSSKK